MKNTPAKFFDLKQGANSVERKQQAFRFAFCFQLPIYCEFTLFTDARILAGQSHLDCGCSHGRSNCKSAVVLNQDFVAMRDDFSSMYNVFTFPDGYVMEGSMLLILIIRGRDEFKPWEDLMDDEEAIETLPEVYGDKFEEFNLLVRMADEKKTKGFANNETTSIICLSMTSRYIFYFFLRIPFQENVAS
ncbi:alpha-dioxygenase 1 [Tanacetum coccineum]|uniref:Alpha-dioxygenase 1 n=1 Tax=Tanacetum coccineum TaxID=301880 RepID=A0ABQ4XKR6_9ASTR